MKIKIVMKDPDTMPDAVREAVKADVAKLGLSKDEAEQLAETRGEKTREMLSRWFQYGEYLGVEFDTDTMTIRVLEVSEH